MLEISMKGQLRSWSECKITATICLAVLSLVGAHIQRSSSEENSGRKQQVFSDRAGEFGIDFVHFNGMTGRHYYPEMVGSGAAFLDFDNDNDLDILIVQGSILGPRDSLRDALFPLRGPAPPKARLFRNDLQLTPAGVASPKFTDVTDRSGIQATGYGMGTATVIERI